MKQFGITNQLFTRNNNLIMHNHLASITPNHDNKKITKALRLGTHRSLAQFRNFQRSNYDT